MRIPVLTYHGVHVNGNDYANNDHIGLAEDLERLHAEGWAVVSLTDVSRAVISGSSNALPERAVAITFDDGSWFDYYDLPHPTYGQQRSLLNILRDFRDRHGIDAQPRLNERLDLIAAFDCSPEPVTQDSDRWRLPRFMFRRDWSEPDELLKVLSA